MLHILSGQDMFNHLSSNQEWEVTVLPHFTCFDLLRGCSIYMYIVLSYEPARVFAQNFATLYINLVMHTYDRLIVRVIITSQNQELASW